MAYIIFYIFTQPVWQYLLVAWFNTALIFWSVLAACIVCVLCFWGRCLDPKANLQLNASKPVLIEKTVVFLCLHCAIYLVPSFTQF